MRPLRELHQMFGRKVTKCAGTVLYCKVVVQVGTVLYETYVKKWSLKKKNPAARVLSLSIRIKYSYYWQAANAALNFRNASSYIPALRCRFAFAPSSARASLRKKARLRRAYSKLLASNERNDMVLNHLEIPANCIWGLAWYRRRWRQEKQATSLGP